MRLIKRLVVLVDKKTGEIHIVRPDVATRGFPRSKFETVGGYVSPDKRGGRRKS